MDKDSKGQRKLDPDRGLLPAMEGHILERNSIELKTTVILCVQDL